MLDGSNILLLHGRQRPELRYVLALCEYLQASGAPFECYFDANASYLLRDYRPQQQAAFLQLTRDTSTRQRFHIVASGTQADEPILADAKEHGSDVISNDLFRDRAREHRWIWKRRHGLLVSNDQLLVATLNAQIALRPTAENYIDTLC